MNDFTTISGIPLLELTREELNELVRAIKQVRAKLDRKEIREFEVSDRVKFDHKGRTYSGLVTKVNQRTVNVTVDSIDTNTLFHPIRYRCRPGALTIVTNNKNK